MIMEIPRMCMPSSDANKEESDHLYASLDVNLL